ncbi:uncharacterized protein AKAW2_80312S [Aspergillus luchuensis]|uniref:Uncharacterized protein n=1 Tax=Aspergillus kawachii TaxID=1069201 RepID=A0A7R7X7E6_ASPKA|nr:uncharacterized protein AKAW2_80312S [Aspergillus luchuensis]BCS04511.1 hypothetical protein AKAW2_80312S [Aspergillus luchuensis]BCS16093.1 hypothetical protein ALUC_80300S [Aspergillus luchuensis]GAA83905.1 hypothetical protein AKAW_02020 [Aspergillus luchuensis IFO 4308]
MKLLSTLVASTLALAVSVQATDCTEGMKYCQSVLIDIDYTKYSTLIPQAIKAYGFSGASLPPGFMIDNPSFLFACGSGGSITVEKECTWGCNNAGAGHNDYCTF